MTVPDEVIAQYTDTTLPELSESGEEEIVSSAKIIADLNQICLGDARCITGVVTGIIDGDTIIVNGMKIRFSLTSAAV